MIILGGAFGSCLKIFGLLGETGFGCLFGILDSPSLKLPHQRFHINKTLFVCGQEFPRGSHDDRIRSDDDWTSPLLGQVVHASPEALRVGVEDFIVTNHLQIPVTRVWLAQRSGQFSTEFGFLISKLTKEEGLTITGGCPDHDLDLSAGSGHGKRRITQGDFQFLAWKEGLLLAG